jgi:hypothetical protein
LRRALRHRVVSIGVNDATGRTRSAKWTERLATLIELLKAKFGVAHILLSSLPPMHAFPALPQPLRWYLGMRARQLNGMLQTIAEADSCCEFLQIDFPFESAYMARRLSSQRRRIRPGPLPRSARHPPSAHKHR